MKKAYIEPISRGESSSQEYRDCTVRALANASFMDYDDAHELLAYHGRPNRKGTSHRTLFAAYTEAGFKNVKNFGTSKQSDFYKKAYSTKITSYEKGITLKNFCEKYSTGRYIVVYSGHALAVVNGKIVDKMPNLANKRVLLAFSQN